MKIGSAFPGQYIKAADLQGKRVQVVVERVDCIRIDPPDSQPAPRPASRVAPMRESVHADPLPEDPDDSVPF